MLLIMVEFDITRIVMVIESNHQHTMIVSHEGQPHFAVTEHIVSVKVDGGLALIMEE